MSCIDPVFSSQPNLVMSSGIHSSLHQNCYHQIIFTKFSLKVHYPPPYERKVWHFKKKNMGHINGFPWERSCANLNINDNSIYLINQLKIYFQISYLMKLLPFDDRDPPWINSQVKHLINEKNAVYKNYLKNNKSNLLKRFRLFRVK